MATTGATNVKPLPSPAQAALNLQTATDYCTACRTTLFEAVVHLEDLEIEGAVMRRERVVSMIGTPNPLATKAPATHSETSAARAVEELEEIVQHAALEQEARRAKAHAQMEYDNAYSRMRAARTVARLVAAAYDETPDV